MGHFHLTNNKNKKLERIWTFYFALIKCNELGTYHRLEQMVPNFRANLENHPPPCDLDIKLYAEAHRVKKVADFFLKYSPMVRFEVGGRT